ncbi:MAG: asparagine synthase-related protein [Alphaproteobacteria bacterium]
MIGLFGIFEAAPQTPVDLASLSWRLPARYAIDAPAGRGAALGRAAHALDRAGGRARDERFDCVVCGELFDPAPFRDLAAGSSLAEIIVALARAEKLERLAEANAQFSAALYDRDQHVLTLITDRLCTHALHVWRQGGRLVFASQLYVLIGDQRVSRAADPAALAQLFTMQRTFGRVTPFRDVSALPAAALVSFDGAWLTERRYWEMRWRPSGMGQRDTAAALAAALRGALARQSSGRVGMLLSGGLDSRTLLAAAPAPMPCWTTASYDNPELAIARETAMRLGAAHHPVLLDPPSILAFHDEAVRDSGGMYPASTPFATMMPSVASGCDIALSGHGLDYTLRGYYMPARFLDIGGSHTRLPALRPLPPNPSGADVIANLRQGPPRATVERIVRPAHRAEWWEGQARTLDEVLAPWLRSETPRNAWDALILHAVSKHYAFCGMMAVRAAADLRLPAFDNEVFEIYLGMKPAWRVAARVMQRAAQLIRPDIARLPNANTGFRADLPGWLEVAGLLGRGLLRRLGLAARPALPGASHSAGSWQNFGALYRSDPAHRARLSEVRGRLDALCFGLLDADALAACIDEHLAGTRSHTKLLRQLLTHDAWVRLFEPRPA